MELFPVSIQKRRDETDQAGLAAGRGMLFSYLITAGSITASPGLKQIRDQKKPVEKSFFFPQIEYASGNYLTFW
jgi:hypothetical protein